MNVRVFPSPYSLPLLFVNARAAATGGTPTPAESAAGKGAAIKIEDMYSLEMQRISNLQKQPMQL